MRWLRTRLDSDQVRRETASLVSAVVFSFQEEIMRTRIIASAGRSLAVFLILAVLPVGYALAQGGAPGSTFRDCDHCPEMVVIPAGEFVMGSSQKESGHTDEKPQHKVSFANNFAVSKTEVTFDQWDACTAAGRCPKADDDGYGRGNYPAINVSWQDAHGYVAWLSETSGQKYRLLSESEFEYAARGGTTTPWFWGEAEASWGSSKACDYSNTHDEAGKEAHPMYVWSHHKCNDGYGENAPTGQYKPNPFGLHDTTGNVREWVEDCHREGYTGAPTDGSVRAHSGACEKRVVRGGAWVDGASTVRSAYRYAEAEDFRNYQVGFRVARDLEYPPH
jgi:formylglycine-generating enzyme required for sulfatase activity